ncbi:MAG: M36 family metallopeptidase [Deltaproteobacteria bacterium]|nr:M36 family metallopeptidase [Deltaproteobacteria bacterium]
MFKKFVVILIPVILFPSFSLAAGWPSDPAVNVPIVTAPNDQWIGQVTNDGRGGAIITWADYRSGTDNHDIYAQKTNLNGSIEWQTNGVIVSSASGNQNDPRLIGDGEGGAIITWDDKRNGTDEDIYAQRIDSNGAALWGHDGISICSFTDRQRGPSIISDGLQGAIIIWEDKRNGSDYDIYAQRVDANGNILWALDGIPIVVAPNGQGVDLGFMSDGAGGVIMTWTDYRNGTGSNNPDIYAQKIDSDGNSLWQNNGVPIVSQSHYQYDDRLVSDGMGGAIITWTDKRDNTGYDDIYAQRIDANGSVLWAIDGIPIAEGYDQRTQADPVAMSDGNGGAIIVFEIAYGDGNLYAQRIDSDGNLLWGATGKSISSASDDQFFPDVMSDGNGGIILAYSDRQNEFDGDIYAQHMDVNGNLLWGNKGAPISTAAKYQGYPRLVTDGSGGGIIVWTDRRSDIDYDIYAQNVNVDGSLGSNFICDHSSIPPATSFTNISAFEDQTPPLRNFDIRVQESWSLTRLSKKQVAILEGLKERYGEGIRVTWNPLSQALRSLMKDQDYLTVPSSASPSVISFDFLERHRNVFGITSENLSDWKVASEYQTSHNGITHLVLAQYYQGVPIFQGQIQFSIDPLGRILRVSGEYYSGIAVSTVSHLSAGEALREVAYDVTLKVDFEPEILSESSDSTSATIFKKGPFNRTDGFHKASLVVFPMHHEFRLAWQVLFHKSGDERYLILVDANSGEILYRINLVLTDQPQGLIFEEDPDDASQVLKLFLGDPLASPQGWLQPHQGFYSTLGGNNSCTQEDRNGDDQKGYSPTATDGHFEYPFQDAYQTSQGTDIDTDLDAALTNLFYGVNFIHDYYYNLGFKEAAGNFQYDNGGQGGLDKDPVYADAQDEWDMGNRNNASFYPTPDGYDPAQGYSRLEIYMNSPPDYRYVDGAFSGDTIIHEYTHGLSTRLVGGPNDVTGLMGVQSGAMGEGWGDWFAGSIYNDPVHGEYRTGDTTKGVRRYAMNQNPLTYEDLCHSPNGCEVHDDGEIWSGTLWDLRKRFIDEYGYEEGKARVEQLIVDGMSGTEVNPSLLDARDAILAADPDGEYGNIIWKTFACRGMGASASTGDHNDPNPVEAFNLPDGTECRGSIVGVLTNVWQDRLDTLRDWIDQWFPWLKPK